VDSQVWLGVIGLLTTTVITAGSVIIAWLSLKERLTRIEGHTNGLLAAANKRGDVATQALADVATTAVTSALPTPPQPPQGTP